MRSDEQLVASFRAGSEEAFEAIYGRYRPRVVAYARQMLGASRDGGEDVGQDVFARAYRALRADAREITLRAWLYRVAHNRCIDELRRPVAADGELLEEAAASGDLGPFEQLTRRERLRVVLEDVRRLPPRQRSALLLREMSGMSYGEIAASLDVSLDAVKSLLVRARVELARAGEARDAACEEIRSDLALARERGIRASPLARRHLRDCADCREYHERLVATGRRLAALAPAPLPLALLAKLLGLGGGAATGGLGAGGATGGAVATGAAASAGAGLSAAHVTAVAVAVVGAAGAIGAGAALEDHPAQHHHHARAPHIAAERAAGIDAAEPIVHQVPQQATTPAAPSASPGNSPGRGVRNELQVPDRPRAQTQGGATASPEHAAAIRTKPPPASAIVVEPQTPDPNDPNNSGETAEPPAGAHDENGGSPPAGPGGDDPPSATPPLKAVPGLQPKAMPAPAPGRNQQASAPDPTPYPYNGRATPGPPPAS